MIMSMILELEPEVETTLRSYAAAEGMTPDLFITRLLSRYEKPSDAEPAWKTRLRASQKRVEQARLDSGLTDAEIEADIDIAIQAYRKERTAPEYNP
jgi:hypothetical protein